MFVRPYAFTASIMLSSYVSFVDYPGSDILMATMLNGAAVMDTALLLVAGTETCVSDLRASSRDYETREHHHFSEDSEFDQGSAGIRASNEHMCLWQKQDINPCLDILPIGD